MSKSELKSKSTGKGLQNVTKESATFGSQQITSKMVINEQRSSGAGQYQPQNFVGGKPPDSIGESN